MLFVCLYNEYDDADDDLLLNQMVIPGSPGCPSYIELTPRMLHVCMRGCLLWMGISALPGGINCLQEESTACTHT